MLHPKTLGLGVELGQVSRHKRSGRGRFLQRNDEGVSGRSVEYGQVAEVQQLVYAVLRDVAPQRLAGAGRY